VRFLGSVAVMNCHFRPEVSTAPHLYGYSFESVQRSERVFILVSCCNLSSVNSADSKLGIGSNEKNETPQRNSSVDGQSTDGTVVHNLHHESGKLVQAGVLEPLLLVLVPKLLFFLFVTLFAYENC